MRSEFKPRTITCRNKRGELVSEPHEVTKVWKDYFQDLLERRDEPIVLQNVHTEQDIIADEENPPPSITEKEACARETRLLACSSIWYWRNVSETMAWTEAAPCGIGHYNYWLTQTTLT
ncbi:uncharacterized protein TNCV_3530451 [Trichonephila clavipes]|nr:uncharacterized protein TNCV_3530451 [Trichonephila clavipes]